MRVSTIMCYPYGEIVKLNLYLPPHKNQLQMHQELKYERCDLKLPEIIQKAYTSNSGIKQDLLNNAELVRR